MTGSSPDFYLEPVYEVMIPLAERIYAEHLKETGQSEEG